MTPAPFRDDTCVYESTYRRSEVAVPALFGVVALVAAAAVAVVRLVEDRHLETAVIALAITTVLLLGLVLVTAFRVHRWTVGPGGVEIHQRPRVPLTGLSRRICVPFPDIAAFRNVENGLDRLIEITTRAGQRFRLSQAMTGGPSDLARPDPGADLGAFAVAIRTAAERAGHGLPATAEGMSFWNGPIGLAFLAAMLAVSLVISGGVAFALWQGMTTGPRPRSGEAIAILLLLPVGAGYLLLRSLRRRAAVRASQARKR
ncbi:hypothetical protein [Phreatobacter sp.]|uniref:hypothetical protein n=1 Tax=Phreatobacter sp. TaxID=1966341 RepID=UPI003F71125D